MISHVLDTCALLDLASGRWSNREAREALFSAKRPVVLAVSVWELARKLRLGKVQLPCKQSGVLAFIESICQRHGLTLESLTGNICESAELLPALHEDPFDRMIIALAARSNCPLFTTDQRFLAYPIQVIAHR